MATSAPAQTFDPQRAAGDLRKNQMAAKRAEPSLIGRLSGYATKNVRGAFLAGQLLLDNPLAGREATLEDIGDTVEEVGGGGTGGSFASSETQFAAAERRQRILSATRRDILPEPRAETYAEDITEEYALGAAAIQEEARGRSITELGPVRERARQLADQAARTAAERIQKEATEQTARWAAKLGGHGSNALDAPGEDGWITFFISYFYDFARAVVTIFVPESIEPDFLQQYQQEKYSRYEARKQFATTQIAQSAAVKAIHTFLPPYRPLQEPVDFAYFLFEAILAAVALTMIAFIFVILAYMAYDITSFLPS